MKHLLHIVLPLFFSQDQIPEIENPELLKAIAMVKSSPNLEAAMKRATDILAAKYSANRVFTYLLYPKIWETNPDKLWQRSGFMHCTQQNFLWRILVTKSGWLRDSQVRLGFSQVWYLAPHQYLVVYLAGDKKLAIDPWSMQMGAKFGEYSSGFGFKTL